MQMPATCPMAYNQGYRSVHDNANVKSDDLMRRRSNYDAKTAPT